MAKKEQAQVDELRAENARLKARIREMEESATPFMDLLRTADEFGPTHKITTDLLANILERAKA